MGVEIGTPEGPIRGKVRVDTGPMSLADLVPTAQELTGVLSARAERREAARGRHIQCRAGCGACCRQVVPLSPPEVFHLMDLVDALDPIRRAAVLGRFEAVEAALEAEGMIEPLLDPERNADPARSLNRKYFHLGLACPFLVNESCSIHADRPVACRDYSVTSNPLWCRDPWAGGVEVVDMPMPLSVCLGWLSAELTESKAAFVPLALARRWAASHAEWRARRWPGLELFQRFMAVVGRRATRTTPAGAPGGPEAPSAGSAVAPPAAAAPGAGEAPLKGEAAPRGEVPPPPAPDQPRSGS